MRFSAALSLALMGTPVAVSATGFLGFALGSKMPNGECKTTDDYAADFDAILKHTDSRIVRGYSTSQCEFAKRILPAAKDKGFQVILGIWPDIPESFNNDKAALQDIGHYGEQVYAVTVGSEALYRRSLTTEQLRSQIAEVKKIIPQTKVGTADVWNVFTDGRANELIRGGVDIILINAFSYWQGKHIDDATDTFFDDIGAAITHIQAMAGSLDSIELMVGETGWPSTGGTKYQLAEPGTENAERFFRSAICAIMKWGVPVFGFSAMDEPWKPLSIGDTGEVADERHWGFMTVDREPKYTPLRC